MNQLSNSQLKPNTVSGQTTPRQNKTEAEHLVEVKEEIKQILRSKFANTEFHCFFFGSRAEGTQRDRSDIDIGIQGPRPLTGPELEELEEAMGRINTLFQIDLVDWQKVSPDFRRVAERYIESIC